APLQRFVEARVAAAEGSPSGWLRACQILTDLLGERGLDPRVRQAAGLLLHTAELAERRAAHVREMVYVEGSEGEMITFTDPAGNRVEAAMEPFYLDRTEVTNGQYREFLEWL